MQYFYLLKQEGFNMGWTGMTPPSHGDKKQWLADEFRQYGEVGTNPSFELTDISIKGREAYGILHVTKTDGTKNGCGMVILLECSAKEWSMKEMSEDMMPYYYNAPKTMIHKLNKLYPTTLEQAVAWREKCLSN
jgi:hypothetical protein